MKLSLSRDFWETVEPFVTSRESINEIETITVSLQEQDHTGRGEALGVDYRGEDADTMARQLENVHDQIEAGLDFDRVASLLPPGGARNALDCALWDLRAKQSGQRVWELLEVPAQPVTTVYTLSLDTPERMAEAALSHARFTVLKLKLNSMLIPERLSAIRRARPDAQLIIDANGAWSRAVLTEHLGLLQAAGVGMVEQPLPAGRDGELEGLNYPVPLCADESCQSSADLPALKNLYQMFNIKLDKCGGLSEAMRMVRWCRDNDREIMVGNMLGSSLAMAPGFVVAQFCTFVDLDGPLWQKTDRQVPLRIEAAKIHPPEPGLWG